MEMTPSALSAVLLCGIDRWGTAFSIIRISTRCLVLLIVLVHVFDRSMTVYHPHPPQSWSLERVSTSSIPPIQGACTSSLQYYCSTIEVRVTSTARTADFLEGDPAMHTTMCSVNPGLRLAKLRAPFSQ